jgi:nucleotide-binding universal stress UspA family protein
MKVLVPLDGSDMAEQALGAADRFLRNEAGGTLILHRVLASLSGKVMGASETISQQSAELAMAESYLNGVRDKLVNKPYDIEVHCSNGPNVAEAIADMAELRGIDVIMMRSHSKTGWRHFLLGSTTYELARMSRVSVLIVKKPDDPR